MKKNELLKNYYSHETILEKINYNKELNEIKIYVKYCEWQLEENINSNIIGYIITFYNVSDISSDKIFNYSNEYILDIIIKQKYASICLDVDDYMDINFKYKTLNIEDIVS